MIAAEGAVADMVLVEAMVDVTVDRRLAEIAASQGIGKAELVADLLRDYATVDPAYAAFVEVGRNDAREGRLVDHAEVVARIERILASDE